MNKVAKAAAFGASVAGACFTWGLIEAQLFKVRESEVAVLPAGAKPVRVLHLSDIHLLPSQTRKLDWLASLADLKPDLVINTGDNISSEAAIDPLMDALSGLVGVPGVFVFGSNDYRAPGFRNPVKYLLRSTQGREPDRPRNLPFGALRRRFEQSGWFDVMHQRVRLEALGTSFAFRGTDDPHLELDDYASVAGPAEAADVNVGVTHAPYLRVLDAMTDDGMDMIFAGHTHGGQVCVPFRGAIVTNCDLDWRRASGVSSHRVGERTSVLEVSAGIGSSPFAPYRFACRPEAALLTLVPNPNWDNPR